MATYSLNPTYYQVTWNLTSPTNFSSLTGNANGGLDSDTAWQINSTIMVTGNTAIVGSPLSDGDSFIINGVSISFLASDTITEIVEKINLATKMTNVTANQMVAGGYLTLMNAPGTEGTPFYIAAGVGPVLSTFGLTAAVYNNYPAEIGSAYTAVTTDSNVTINGINIVSTGGPLTVAGAAAQLNAETVNTGIVAYEAGPYMQLASVGGQPWSINSGNAYTNLGFTLGNHGGYPTTLANSQAKERANMRWTQMIAELEAMATPNKFGNIVRSGNISNVEASTVTFTVGYDQPGYVRTVARDDEPDAGTVFEGADAIKRAVARALVVSMISNRKVFDPTLQSYGAYCDRPNAARIQSITADAMDVVANITVVEQNITVTQIAGV